MATLKVYFGDPSQASTVVGKVQKMYNDEYIVLLKSCASHAMTGFLTLTPSSVFYDFTADVAAKIVFFMYDGVRRHKIYLL